MGWRDDDQQAERDWTAAVIALADIPFDADAPSAPAPGAEGEETEPNPERDETEPEAADSGQSVEARPRPTEPGEVAAASPDTKPGEAHPADQPTEEDAAGAVARAARGLNAGGAVVVVPAHDPEESAELTRQLHRLAVRVDIMAGLVDNLFDRLAPVSEQGPLTTERLADISARMVQLLEQRLEVHSERLEQTVRAFAARIPTEVALDPASKSHLAQLEEQLLGLARSVLDVKQQVAGIAPEADLSPVIAHVDDRFDQANTKLGSDIEYLRRDLTRNDQMLLEMQSRLAELPDRQSLRDLSTGLAQVIESATSVSSLSELTEAISKVPERVALEQPIDRLDAAIIQQIDARLEETAERMSQKLDEQLAARVQRFEALSQSMMTLAGEPVEALAEKLQQLSKLSDPVEVLADEILELRREGREREALLRHLLAALSPEEQD